MIRVAIAEDHIEMRTALRLLLRLSDTIELVCEVSDGQQAVDCVKHLQPDVMLMDIRMPVLDGLAAAKLIKDLPVSTRVLLISSDIGEYIVTKATDAGAHGYLPKSNLAKHLISAIETVHRGEEYFVKK